MRALPTYLLRVLEKRFALMASPPHVSPDASELASTEWEGFLRVTGVAVGIFVEFRSMSGQHPIQKRGHTGNERLSRTDRTAHMFACLALRSFTHEERVTFMAGPANPLHGSPACQLFPGSAGRHGQGDQIRATLALVSGGSGQTARGKSFALVFQILGFLRGVSRAFLATGMLTVVAYLFRTKGS